MTGLDWEKKFKIWLSFNPGVKSLTPLQSVGLGFIAGWEARGIDKEIALRFIADKHNELIKRFDAPEDKAYFEERKKEFLSWLEDA